MLINSFFSYTEPLLQLLYSVTARSFPVPVKNVRKEFIRRRSQTLSRYDSFRKFYHFMSPLIHKNPWFYELTQKNHGQTIQFCVLACHPLNL